jgi:multidrug efflux pump subunit AcrA (membrane-fusion protein)
LSTLRGNKLQGKLIGFALGSVFLLTAGWWIWERTIGSNGAAATESRAPQPVPHAAGKGGAIQLSKAQQTAIGLRTEQVALNTYSDKFVAPGRVAPNEAQFAYITPRARGVVRSVLVHIGQDVRAGDLLATIDSPEVGEARLELYTKLQTLEVARSQAAWQKTIYHNTLDLIEQLQKGALPEQIHNDFADKAVGQNRERLVTAYAQYRLGVATIERNRDLYNQKLITPKQFQQVNADYEVAQATYQSLMDQMGYEARLAHTRAEQALKQAETAVRAAQEHLRILGVKADGTEPEVEGGKVVGVKPDGKLDASEPVPSVADETPATILPESETKRLVVAPVGTPPDAHSEAKEIPVSTYSIWAPFDGTILDRETIVPGVAVDTAHRIFTMANLATVWVEADVHENDFDMLARSRGGGIQFRSPAYPGRVFEGEVTYSGDLVEEKSRSVKLLARAKNPDRLLKPGMFVEVEIHAAGATRAAQVPTSALLTEGNRSFVFVRTGADRFDRRDVTVEPPHGDFVTVRRGLEQGDDVVVEGAFKLKALAIQKSSAVQ